MRMDPLKQKVAYTILAGTLLSGCYENRTTPIPKHPEPECDSMMYTSGLISDRGDYEDLGFDNYMIGLNEYKFFTSSTTGSSLPKDFIRLNPNVGPRSPLYYEGCGGSMFFYFTGGGLHAIAVRRGWQGETDTGLSLSREWDHLDDFLEAYPNAKERELWSNVFIGGEVWTSGHVKINTTRSGYLQAIEISPRDYDEDVEGEPVFPAGPDHWW